MPNTSFFKAGQTHPVFKDELQAKCDLHLLKSWGKGIWASNLGG